MPMPKFPYGQGHFFKAVNDYWKDPQCRDLALTELQSGKPLIDITDERRLDSTKPSGITQAERDHFADHWLTSDVDGKSPSFPHVTVDCIERVMREGYIQAIQKAEHKDFGGSKSSPLPMSVAWVCNTGATTFDMVTIVNPGVHVQVLVISPVPLEFSGASGHNQDNVFVTRFFANVREVKDVKNRLDDLGDPDPVIKDPSGNPLQNPGANGEVGTFRIWL